MESSMKILMAFVKKLQEESLKEILPQLIEKIFSRRKTLSDIFGEIPKGISAKLHESLKGKIN